MRSVSHLREDARWCTFREIASNVIPGDRTIAVLECECRIALRIIDTDETAHPASGRDDDAATPSQSSRGTR